MTSPASTRDALSPEPYPGPPPAFAVRLVFALRRLLQRAADALVPAEVALFERSIGAAMTQALGAAARLRIADLLAEGPLDAPALAARLGTHPDATHRWLRCLATGGVFTLHPDGRFENNRLSAALLSGSLARAREWAEYFGSPANLAAWHDFEQTLRSGKNAFARVQGMGIWSWFDHHPGERETFAHAMMGLTVADAPFVAHLYPFSEVRRLCDVGGGRGTLLSELLIRHPHLHGVLCDGAGVIDSARELLRRRGVLPRVELVPGSFFEAVPAGCDAYLLKNILHDWDDARCLQILKVVHRAMAPGNRLLLVEFLVEPNRAEGLGPLSDLQMMVVCDEGRERSRHDFQVLLEASGFRFTRVFEGPTMGVVEGVCV